MARVSVKCDVYTNDTLDVETTLVPDHDRFTTVWRGCCVVHNEFVARRVPRDSTVSNLEIPAELLFLPSMVNERYGYILNHAKYSGRICKRKIPDVFLVSG